MTLRWGHWQPREDDPALDRLWDRLLDRICPQPLVTVLPNGRVMLDDCWVQELALDDLDDALRRAELRRALEDRRRPWLESLIAALAERIAAEHAAAARHKAAPAVLRWGPEEPLEVAPPARSKPKIPTFRGSKGGR